MLAFAPPVEEFGRGILILRGCIRVGKARKPLNKRAERMHCQTVFIDALSKLGIRIEPFDLFLEGLDRGERPARPGWLEGGSVNFLAREDMTELARMPGRDFSQDELEGRLRSGQLCLGVRHQEKIIAFTWCHLTECRIETHRLFELSADEASLFDAYTLADYRGRNLAPWMRYRCYEEMAKLGRQCCFSVTIIFNTPAVRFKEKLGARVIGKGVYVELLGRMRFHLGATKPARLKATPEAGTRGGLARRFPAS